MKSIFVDLKEFGMPSDGSVLKLPMSQNQISIQANQTGTSDTYHRVTGRLNGISNSFSSPSVYGTEHVTCYQGPVIHDINGNELANHVVGMRDESTGWTGDVQTCGYERHHVTISIPPNAHYLSFIMSSGQEAPANLGVLALRRCLLTLVPAKEGLPTIVVNLLDAERGNDQHWARHGNKLDMAGITTSQSNGQSMLVIEDHHAEKWAGWVSEHIGLGDFREVRVEWEAAYSMGLPFGFFVYHPTAHRGIPGPGPYEFEMQPMTIHGLPSGKPIKVPFIIQAPFYQTGLFRLVMGFVVVLGIIRIVRQTTKARMQRRLNAIEKQRAVEHERARIARDLHDHLGADLTQLAMLSDLLQQPTCSLADKQHRLNQLFDLAQGMTRQVDEIVWTVNPEHDSLGALVAYLSTHTQQYLGAAGLRCRLRIPDTLPEVVITAARRHHLFMLLKEALHNIVKHAHATEVSLEITASPQQFTLSICDDGQGLPGDLKPGDGLPNIQERARQAGGTLTIDSQPGSGTRLHLIVTLTST